MSVFNEREKAFENKFGQEQVQEFQTCMTRNQLIGLWMAAKIGLQGKEADLYVEEVMKSDFERPGPEDVIEKLMQDIKQHGLDISEEQIRRKMSFFHEQAQEKRAAK
jgi:hypothetical protein